MFKRMVVPVVAVVVLGCCTSLLAAGSVPVAVTNQVVPPAEQAVRAFLALGAIFGAIFFFFTRGRLPLGLFVFSSAGLNALNIAANLWVQVQCAQLATTLGALWQMFKTLV